MSSPFSLTNGVSASSSRATSSSPAMPSTRATSPPTSPATVPDDLEDVKLLLEDEEEDEDEKKAKSLGNDDGQEGAEQEDESSLAQLETLLQRSATYVTLLKSQMDQARIAQGRRKAKPQPERKNTKKRSRVVSDSEDERESKRHKAKGQPAAENGGVVEETSEEVAFEQPALVTGATLKDYQLEGVAWMAGLHQNGISGILADEMGLGKTIQTIAFHAFLRERTPAPFMVVCPVAVLENWAREFARFAPDIPVVIYYGDKQTRADIRRTQMVMDAVDKDYYRVATGQAAAHEAAEVVKRKAKAASRGRGRGRGKRTARGRGREEESSEDEAPPAKPKTRGKSTPRGRRGGRAYVRGRAHPAKEAVVMAGSDEFEESMAVDEELPCPAEERNKWPLKPHQKTNFPVVLTTYKIVMNDRAELAKYHWGFIVVDEGHRLKNADCQLMRDLKRIPTAARMILTGTPLQNNLTELWSLLNFVLPDLFGDLSMFQSWFDENRLQNKLSSERQTKLIHSLHDILRPFLLRRMKADVEMQLPPKKEYVLYTPLSERQRQLYEVAVQGERVLREHLIQALITEAESNGAPEEELSESDEEKPLVDEAREKKRKDRGLREKTTRDYVEDSDDEQYFKRLDEGQIQLRKERERTGKEVGLDYRRRAATKEVNNMNLKNVVMQLRKVCQHPYLFHWPKDPSTLQRALNEELVTASGKMMVLERLLDALFARGHKVLIFSQFTTMLDILEDWATELKEWPVCRIDGDMKMGSREEHIHRFQQGGDAPDAPRLFLISTRSGGLGINLVAADTVIFYDQDWNPQMDVQAQDRAHRIGQTRPVLIFRLLCAHTIEKKIMQRATGKRKLEALVIAKGEFVNPAATRRNKSQALADMAVELHRLEGEKIQVVPNTAAGKASVISDEELDVLLDRRPEVFADRQKGWTSTGQIEEGESDAQAKSQEVSAVGIVEPDVKTKTKTAFAVYEAPVDPDGNVLGMMDEMDEIDDDGEE